jgi:hypothetical protein
VKNPFSPLPSGEGPAGDFFPADEMAKSRRCFKGLRIVADKRIRAREGMAGKRNLNAVGTLWPSRGIRAAATAGARQEGGRG